MVPNNRLSVVYAKQNTGWAGLGVALFWVATKEAAHIFHHIHVPVQSPGIAEQLQDSDTCDMAAEVLCKTLVRTECILS